MTSIKLILTGAQAWAAASGPLTSGMVGIPVLIEYDEAWDGLTKNLMCRCSPWGSNDGEIRTILNIGDTSTVAHEVMQEGMYLYLGVEGFSNDGKLVIPTTWARCGKIEYGANTCEDPSADPELPIWNQLQTEVEQIKRDGYTQEQIDEIQAYVQSASQSASSAARSKESAAASSSLAASYVNTARNSADNAQTYAENASASAGSAANLANGALQAQRAAEAAAERAEAAVGSGADLNLSVETITVGEESDEPVAVTGVALDLSSYDAEVGGGFYINASVLPTNATNRGVNWESSNTAVATVNDMGYVECIAEGNAVITCITEDGGYTATCAVNVAADESGGEEDSGGDSTGGKIQYITLERIDGGVKANGDAHTLSNVQHVVLPYTEGMVVRSMWKPGWDDNHCPLVLLSGGEYSRIADFEYSDYVSSTETGLEATLTGLPDGSTIIVNFVKRASDSLMVEMDYYWYMPGGES